MNFCEVSPSLNLILAFRNINSELPSSYYKKIGLKKSYIISCHMHAAA